MNQSIEKSMYRFRSVDDPIESPKPSAKFTKTQILDLVSKGFNPGRIHSPRHGDKYRAVTWSCFGKSYYRSFPAWMPFEEVSASLERIEHMPTLCNNELGDEVFEHSDQSGMCPKCGIRAFATITHLPAGILLARMAGR